MRRVLAAGGIATVFTVAILSGFFLAQATDLDRLRLQSLQQQNMQAQEQQNVLSRSQADLAQARADQDRLATEQTLRASRPVGPVLSPPPQSGASLRRLQDSEPAPGAAQPQTLTR